MRKPRRPLARAAGQLVTFTTPPGAAGLAPAGDAASDRVIEGLVVPFGVPGATSHGLLTFGPGDLTWSEDLRRVKLLPDHDQSRPAGYALALAERPEGIWGRFRVAEGEAGDRLIAEAAAGLRDGMSVGVALDGATEARLRRAAPGTATRGVGRIRETSMVAVPAFDDARVGQLAAANAATATGASGLATMTTPAAGVTTSTAPPPAEPAPATAAGATTSAPAAPAAATTTGTPPAPATAAGPTTVRAAAGAVTVTTEPATYTLDGRGASLVRDAYSARFDGDTDAAGRLRRFNAELAAGNPSSVGAFMRAASPTNLATAAPGDPIASPALTSDVDIPAVYLPSANRADLLLAAVDAGRPICSRLRRIPITSAAPFLVPIEGEFSGVADHTEGTPHAAEGTLTLDDAPVQPRAVSGAYRVSRELVDASNPAIDSIAARAMLRDYRRVSEGKVVTALLAAVDEADYIYGVDTAMEMRAALVGLVDDDDFPMDFVASSRQLVAALYADVDGDGRPMLAGPGSTAPSVTGPARAGYTGLTVDGTELVRASRVPANLGIAVRAEGVLFVESNVQQFRFDEVEGPGVLKLALWAYVGAAVLRASDVAIVSTQADPTP